MINSAQMRQLWLDFFESKDHLIVPTKNLIPYKDNSLLWINSGVATLKDYFSGKKKPIKNRLVNSQKAIRTNDIENVGVTTRHHTFFEMLGNFSIGDYFKKEAIEFAIELLVRKLKMDPKLLYVTYYYEDLETRDLWIKNGIEATHLIKGTKETNFWEVGSGPCGPNTEIFYDRGEKFDKRGIELLEKDIDNDRFIEIWNIVFSTYNSDGEGNYTELKQKNIDTGAGLERICAILQDVPTNYDTDLFMPIIKEVEKLTNFKYDMNDYFKEPSEQTKINIAFKIIADHMRTVANAIGDGAKISNIGRGYIIRRLIRRSYYQSFILKITQKTFLHSLVKVIKSVLPFEYDEKLVASIIEKEELLFAKTIEKGRNLLLSMIHDGNDINAKTVFHLYETYGFPFELTIEILKEFNIDINQEDLEKFKIEHANKSRNVTVSGMKEAINSLSSITEKITEFIGYETLNSTSKIIFMANQNKQVENLNGKGYIILDKTPFYATSGGQNHDQGSITQNGNIIKVLDVFKDKNGNHVHLIEGKINISDPVEVNVDPRVRIMMTRGHSATHIMFSLMRNILGSEIKQLGSDINEERFTFDFPSDERPSDDKIEQIESEFNKIIKKHALRHYDVITLDQAKKAGAYMTLEEMEYMDPKAVRMVTFENITKDLCGGTHVENTSVIENFKIVSVEKKAAGVFRIRAITSNKLVDEYLSQSIEKLKQDIDNINSKILNLDSSHKLEFVKFETLSEELKYLNKYKLVLQETLKKLSKEANKNTNIDLELTHLNISGKELVINLETPANAIKVQGASLRETYPNSIIILASPNESGALICCASHKYNSAEILKSIFNKLDGKGGGNAIFSIGKINSVNNLFEIIKEVIASA